MTTSIFALIAALATAQTPDLPGPHAVSSAAGYTFALPNGDIQGDIFWPMDSTEPAPIVVIGHGFQRPSRALAGWGSHLASHGMIVALPNFPGGFRPDHAANGARMSAIIELLRSTPGPITAIPDPMRSAVMGHSAGGLAALFAAAGDPTISLFVGLDPVDGRGGEGLAAVPSIVQPSLVIAGDPSLCNNQASAVTLWAAFTSDQSWFLRVKDAAHFDGEDPSDSSIIVNGCGGSDSTRRTLFRRYATAHLLAHFQCAGTDYLFSGRGTADDVASGVILELTETSPATPCGAGSSDAGTPPPAPDASTGVADANTAGEEDASAAPEDAGRADSGIVTPPPPVPDASTPNNRDAGSAGAMPPGTPDATASAPPEPAEDIELPEIDEEGCGCQSTGGPENPAVFGGVFLLMSLLGLGRRRRS